MATEITPPFQERIPAVRLNYNVGCLFDIPTGEFVIGQHGEAILNGGLGAGTGFGGKNNLGKSTIMHGLNATAVIRYTNDIIEDGYKSALTYDTEVNLTQSRMERICSAIEGYTDANNPITDGRWNLSDKTMFDGGEVWFTMFKDYLKWKVSKGKKFIRDTPFLERDGVTLMKTVVPTFTEIDSLSEFETSAIAELKDKVEVGHKDRNMIYARQGLHKHGMISELPRLIALGSMPLSVTVHIGKKIDFSGEGNFERVFTFLPMGDTIKGVPGNFNFLVTILWQIVGAAPLLNDSTKAPEYPAGSDDDQKKDSDLTLVTVNILRNKFGRSGLVMQLLVSQEKGLLPSLTEFHYCKTNDRWGLKGDNTNYRHVFCPDIALGRTLIRPKIEKHPELRRALNICAELLQMKTLWTDDLKLFCTPNELYDDLIAMGYDWPTLLATRGWWAFDNDKHPIPFLSSLDLLRMRKGLYVPYWWPKDKAKP
jgi:hypothetical protein